MADCTPREGDYALVWWNTGWRAPEWAGSYYIARVHRVRPYKGRLVGPAYVIELDNAVAARRPGPIPMTSTGDDPRALWRTHPNNPNPEAEPV